MSEVGPITSVRLSKLMSTYPPTSDLFTALPRTVETGSRLCENDTQPGSGGDIGQAAFRART
jgi:hypothetical protein